MVVAVEKTLGESLIASSFSAEFALTVAYATRAAKLRRDRETMGRA
jgi:hypothetical protein